MRSQNLEVGKAEPEDLDPFRSLRGRRCPPGRFIGDGCKVVRRMLEGGLAVERVLLTERWLPVFEDRLARHPDAHVRLASEPALSDLVGFRIHQGVMAMARIPEPPPLGRGRSFMLALDGLSNAENVGAIVRSAAAFGVEALLVGKETCSPWLRRAVRASMGGVLQVPIYEGLDLAGVLREFDAVPYAADIRGERVPIAQADLRSPVCLVLGSEASGVSPSVRAACKATVYIPMAEDWECLNVGAAAAVLLYEVRRRIS